MGSNMGYSQTGPRGPDDYQLKPHEFPVPKTPKEPKDKSAPTPTKNQDGTYMATKNDGDADDMKPGGGGRFAALKSKLSGQKGVSSPGGLAAYIGRQKYGKAAFQKMAAKGKKGN